MKKLLIGTLAGGLTLFLLGYVIYVVAMPNPEFAHGPAAAAANRETPDIAHIIIGELLFGFLLTYILHTWAAISTPAAGAKAGALLGGVIALAFSLLMFGTTNIITIQGCLYEAVTWVVRWAVAGAVVALVLSKVRE